MIIEIPPQHIFSIENQKVIDNAVDRIELQVKVPSLVTDYDTILTSQNFTVNNYEQGNFQSNGSAYWAGKADASKYDYVAVYVSMQPQYCNLTVSFPKKQKNSIIQSIKDGVNSDNEPNIKYSTVCTIYESAVSAKYNNGDKTITDVSVNYPLIGTEQTVNLPKSLTETESMFGGNLQLLSATANLTLEDKTNLGSVTITQDSNNYYFNCKVLCGIETYELKGKGEIATSAFRSMPVNGIATKYAPKQVNITVYGNTITLNLENENIAFGNGKNILGYDSSELIQSTNTPTLQETYQKIIDNWNEGKETATIKCGINDYYATSRRTEIDVSFAYRKICKFTAYDDADSYNIGDRIETDQGDILLITSVENDVYTADIIKDVRLDEYTYLATVYPQAISVTKKWGLPMTFHLGDTVIPYVRVGSGGIKPMSKHSDGTPKQFNVVGKKIIYDGGIWQELQLLEKTE